MPKLPQEQIDQDAYLFVMAAKKHFEEMRRTAGYELEWTLADRSYFNDTQSFYNGLAKVRVPALHNSVENIVPILDKGAFPPDGNFLDARAEDPDNETLVEQAEHAKALLKKQFTQVSVRTKLVGCERSLATYGTLFIKTYWEHKIKGRYKRDSKGESVKVWETTYDNPDFYNVNIRDIYADIKDENLEGLLIERIVTNYQDLYNNRVRKEKGKDKGIYRNVDKLKDTRFKSTNDPAKQNEEQNKGMYSHAYGAHEHKIQKFECWGPIPKYFITGMSEDKELGLYEDGFIVCASGGEESGVTLRIDCNPFDHQEKPYIRCPYIKVDGRLYGLGVMTVNIPLEAELNTTRCQSLDMRTRNLRPKWIADRSANIDPKQLKDETDNVVESDTGVNGVLAIRPNDMTNSAIASEQNAKGDIADGTGAKPIISGSPNHSSVDRTSVGVSTVAQGALGRIDMVSINFEEFLKKLCFHFWALDQQYLEQPREVQISGLGLVKVDPRTIPLPQIAFVGMKGLGEKEMRINQGNILIQNLAPYTSLGIDPVPVVLEQVRLMGWGHLIPEIDQRPDSKLEDTPEGEVQLLQQGKKVKVNINDDHKAFIQAYLKLLSSDNLPGIVKFNTEEALGQRRMIMGWLQHFDDINALIKEKSQVEVKDE